MKNKQDFLVILYTYQYITNKLPIVIMVQFFYFNICMYICIDIFAWHNFNTESTDYSRDT